MKLLLVLHRKELTAPLAAAFSHYEVHTCTHASAALALLESLKPDILITDLRLVGMDGLTLLGRCRNKPPILLALTDFVTTQLQDAAAAAGVQALIRIPCTVSYVRARLQQLLDENTPSQA